jgi:hypothetical protein
MPTINKLFRNESKIMLFMMVGPIVIGIILSVLVPLFMHSSEIDKCLDDGGSFNYQICKCDFENTHLKFEGHKC